MLSDLRKLFPGQVTGALSRAENNRMSHLWTAIDTTFWRAAVIPALVYFRSYIIYIVIISVILHLIAHITAYNET